VFLFSTFTGLIAFMALTYDEGYESNQDSDIVSESEFESDSESENSEDDSLLGNSENSLEDLQLFICIRCRSITNSPLYFCYDCLKIQQNVTTSDLDHDSCSDEGSISSPTGDELDELHKVDQAAPESEEPGGVMYVLA
jgi:hypothetical protein